MFNLDTIWRRVSLCRRPVRFHGKPYNINLTLRTFCTYTHDKCNLSNYLLLLGKQHLWTCRRDNCLFFLPSLIETVKRKCKIEHVIAVKHKRNNLKMFQAKWKFFLKKRFFRLNKVGGFCV